jgi:hypothetical protein
MALEITRMRADVAISRAEWVARSMALRESLNGHGGHSVLATITPLAWRNAERFETPLSRARVGSSAA